MRSTFATLAVVAAVAANPTPQGVSDDIKPSTPAPAGCKSSYDGTFNLEVVNVTSSATKRNFGRDNLTLKLADGILTDAQSRIGSIVANGQFQFDGPPAQTGAKYTAGWSVCANNSLALGGQTVFYQCLTGDFYNLYDHSLGGQCGPVYFQAINGGSNAAQSADGQVTAGPGAVTQITDGQPQAPTGKPVTQISDGQPQAPTGNVITQISDGQPQAPTGKVVTQISDGQPQAPTGAVITQISDGQPQAPKATGKVVTQISDGQPQAPTGAVVTQISDGQPQAPKTTPMAAPTRPANGTRPATSSTPIAATGGAAVNMISAFGIFAGAVAIALL